MRPGAEAHWTRRPGGRVGRAGRPSRGSRNLENRPGNFGLIERNRPAPPVEAGAGFVLKKDNVRQLIHFLDVIHWYLKLEKPTWAVAMGGIYHCKDGRDVPDTFTASLEYPEGVIVSYDCCSPDQTRKEGIELIFMGTGGRLHVFRNGYRFIPAKAEAAEVTGPGREGNHHMKNWLDCIRSRQQPNANVVDGHSLATACHLTNMAYFEKRPAYWQDAWNLEV